MAFSPVLASFPESTKHTCWLIPGIWNPDIYSLCKVLLSTRSQTIRCWHNWRPVKAPGWVGPMITRTHRSISRFGNLLLFFKLSRLILPQVNHNTTTTTTSTTSRISSLALIYILDNSGILKSDSAPHDPWNEDISILGWTSVSVCMKTLCTEWWEDDKLNGSENSTSDVTRCTSRGLLASNHRYPH